MTCRTRSASCLAAVAAMVVGLGCRQDMHDQPRYKPYAASTFFADGTSARPQVPGTVARGQLDADEQLYTGRVDGQFAATFPFAITEATLERGQQRFDIYCAPCHGLAGYGDGMVVRRGFKKPPALHSERHRASAPGYYFDVMTRGFGAMPSYAAQVSVDDRWAIVAYIRALQLSQHAPLDDVPGAERAVLLAGPSPSSTPATGAEPAQTESRP